jgi:Uma2 family endonuclease
VAVLSDNERERFLPFAPDFLIEILSPSDSLAELDAKMQRWIANGVRVAWRIDPFGGTVAFYSESAPPVVLIRPEAIDRTGPVTGFQLPMARVWG